MCANHNRFSPQLRNQLKTTVMGLGLVRLLQDAGRNEEARSTLLSLVKDSQAPGEKTEKPVRNARKANRYRIAPAARIPVRPNRRDPELRITT